jgi:folate-dependent tRNA-U54 methylase TrmFO/GidA
MTIWIALAALAAAAYAASNRLTVTVEEAKIRKTKMFYAPAVATAHHGDTLEAGEHDGGWYAVTFEGAEGFVHESAVSTKAGKAKAGKWSGSSEATAEEVTLAGKGFNEDVEKAYKKANRDLDFGLVDKMEKRQVSDKDMLSFMTSGKTLPQEAR